MITLMVCSRCGVASTLTSQFVFRDNNPECLPCYRRLSGSGAGGAIWNGPSEVREYARKQVDEAFQRGREQERAERKTDDTCRLDFMEHTQIDAMKVNGQWEILSMSGDTAETIGTGDTLRAAIDAAMNAENGDV
ncbi:hypothetical protein NO263_03900 [Gluconacetobacter entanii]|uniref:Uncharacterized protein n=2 Tax=Acetobacteraceae TaxID=433 RepID=A0ABQ0SFS4_NOVHA|nr:MULTISPECIES: hypothetical protein [Acetobacteraceae]MCW4589720.1 hypothetical protein [Gluconacetobacter entanii]MCW4593423.1 hypothetical protein [Gluconacetobacter entanii]NPC89226.1 hypothetical protein [Gluconacetobacter entanii]GAN83772.1 hypothetical protein Gaha_0105_007 [Novacetimonas hansenii JCM 7643]GBQ62984.1 hypothetical protein AA0243_3008 [Novacetimonas hansenii NRIC 0243]